MARQLSASVVTDTAVVTTAETAAITTAAISQSVDGEPITVRGTISYLTGAGTTAVTVRVREGSGVAGAVVGETLPHTIGAAADVQLPFEITHSPVAVARQQYTVTIQATGASGNGTVKAASATVSVGQP